MNTHFSSIIEAVNYIENHIKENLSMGDIADHIGFSKFHFARIFHGITGYNPYDYYRGRKITEAISYMKETDCKIIDAAYEYGFNSPEVFTRSCLSVFGYSPSQIKKQILDRSFIGFKAIDPYLLNKYQEYEDLKVTSESLPPLLIKGYTYTSKDYYGETDLNSDLIQLVLENNETLYHLHWSDTNSPKTYHHLIGTSTTLDNIDISNDFSTFVFKQLPECEYLIFPLLENGKEFSDMRDYIYEYYLPQNEYIADKLYHVEAIRFGKDRTPATSRLYLPINRKQKRRS